MKKVVLWTILCLFFVSLVYASQIIVIKDTVKPNIAATFNETVVLDDYSWIFGATDEKIIADNSTSDFKTFVFTPKIPLVNGVYLFTVNAFDIIGNLKVFERTIIINVNQTSIYFNNPLHGIGQSPNFDVNIGTSREAICRWDFALKLFNAMSTSSFFNENSKTISHLIKPSGGWKNIETSSPDTIHVKCIDIFDLNVKNDNLQIGYDSTPPVITVRTNSPVRTYPPKGIITVESSDKSVCYIGGAVFSGQSRITTSTFTKLPIGTINYPSDPVSANGLKTYKVKCENLAGLLSEEKTVQISVQLAENLELFVDSPADYIKGQLNYKITSNKAATECTATLNKPDNSKIVSTLTDVSPIEHSLAFGTLVKGTYIADFECKSGTERASARKTFIVDTTPPSITKINATGCTFDKLSLKFLAYDNESGIGSYNYSVSGTNVSINWTPTASGTVERTGLRMAKGKVYTILVKAINKAGIPAATPSSLAYTFNPNMTLACQEKIPPTIKLNVTNSTYGKDVKIICYDASGCDLPSIKYGLSDVAKCNVTISYSKSILFTKPQTICWFAKDKVGNIATGSQFIQLKALGTTCTNGIQDGTETDKDCGGSCLGCAVNLKCSLPKDCAENYCDNKVCKKPLCTDNLKNGFESDLDCGGSSCNGCSLGKICTSNLDCLSNSCNISVGKTEGICTITSCTDNIKNGFETDVDCGGSSCKKCDADKICAANSDCSSGLCQFAKCARGRESWEEFAARYELDPNDKDGDSDGDGISNYDEYLNGTDPTIPDVEAGTSNLYRYLLLAIGAVALIIGVLFLTYFKTDKNTSASMIAVGGIALLLVIIDWLLFLLPKYVLVPVALVALLATGYLTYNNQTAITRKLSGKSQLAGSSLVQKISSSQTAIEVKQRLPETKKEKEDLEATKKMIAMLKQEKLDKERKREDLFSSFDQKGVKKEVKKIEIKKEAIKQIEPIKREVKKTNIKLSAKTQPKFSEFDLLSSLSKGSNAMERLSNMNKGGISDLDRLRKKEEAFSKLSRLPKTDVEDVFSKLPKPEPKKTKSQTDTDEKNKKRGKK
ncbi:MAG: hypothetical protein AABW88_02490 [Nanoarchaeota archaeon]